MLVHRSLIAGLAGLAFALPAPANAAIIMDFSDNGPLKGQLEVQAYAFQRSAPPVGRQCHGQRGRGSFTVTKPVDGVSPQLALASQARKGSLLQIDDTKPDGTHVAFQFTDATISKIESASTGEPPMESISFNYTKVQWEVVGCKGLSPIRRDFYRCKDLQALGCTWRDPNPGSFRNF
jgi:type VI protein secretion system component Hcp